jgi:hypothetical protein
MTQKAFEDYNAIVALLANPESMSKAKSKMLKINPKFMKHLVLAVNGFDPEENELRMAEVKQIMENFDELADLVDHSAQFTYTDAEIDKVLAIKGGK